MGRLAAQDKPALTFIENKNQWPETVDFAARVPGGLAYVSPAGFSLVLHEQKEIDKHHGLLPFTTEESDGQRVSDPVINGHRIDIFFTGANAQATPYPSHQTSPYYNFFVGLDSSRWGVRAHGYTGITYASVYKDIDLVISSSGINLKYDFIVKPEADPAQVKIEYCGATELFLDNENIVMKTSVGDLIEVRPFCYQLIDGIKHTVKSRYTLAHNTVSFEFPDSYDPCYALIIDPLLIFSTYSGSTADNWGSTATPGEHGMLYSSGTTNAYSGGFFPATPGAFQTSQGGAFDIAILKYDSTGGQLLYASYLGGSDNETPHSLVMDSATHDLLVLGTTSSADFPVTANAVDKTFNGGDSVATNVIDYYNGADIIVSRISSAGDQLIASTFLGGTKNDGINPRSSPLTRNYGDEMRGDIITDKFGNIFISSVSGSADFPAASSFSTVYRGGVTDAILVKLTPGLTAVEWGAFIGGTLYDASHTLKFDAAGDIYLAGGSNSTNFPVTTGVYQPALAGQADGWIAHVDKNGTAILHATYTGSAGFDQAYFIDLNSNDEVYIYGQTNGSIPVTSGVYRNANSGQFIQKFSRELNTLLFSTVVGSGAGIPDISPTAFLVSDCNNLYLAGWGGFINSALGYWPSDTQGMPVTPDALQPNTSGSDFYFMVLTDDATELLYATYLGGSQSKTHVDGGTSRFDKSGIVYHAVCSGCSSGNETFGPTSDFPTTPGAWSNTNNSLNCNNAAFKFDLSSLRARLVTNSVAFDQPGLAELCFPDSIRFQNYSIGGEYFEWDLGDGTILTKPDTVSFTHQYQEAGQYRVTLKAIDQNTCIGADVAQKLITIHKNSGTAMDADICYATSHQLTATGGVQYTWRDLSGAVIAPEVHPLDTTQYVVTIVDTDGCVARDTAQVNVVPKIDVALAYEFIADCFSRPTLSVTNTTNVLSDETYVFDFGDGSTSELSEVTHYYEADGDYTVKLTGHKEFCDYETSIELPVFTIRVPNVITPGATAGLNDRFMIEYGEAGQTPAAVGIRVSVTVFNRWGKKIYESENYQYDWSAEGQEPGIYYYQVTIGSGAPCKSWIHVIR